MASFALCLAGPTGAGKTALAIGLAQKLGCEIINADSRQLYRDFPIITAQPNPAEKAMAVHHLYGCLSTEQKISVADWLAEAGAVAEKISAAGKIPLFVGGTGFYFQALLHGLAEIPAIDPAISSELLVELRRDGVDALYLELEQADAPTARRLHPHDRQRILRALEVWRSTGKPLSWWCEQPAPPPRVQGPLFVLDVSLDLLAPRLEARIEQMLACGAEEEARQAVLKCPDLGAPGWSAIGCREALAMQDADCDPQAMRQKWLKSTRAYAKRQLTWFRGRKESIWVKPEQSGAVLRHPNVQELVKKACS